MFGIQWEDLLRPAADGRLLIHKKGTVSLGNPFNLRRRI